MPAWKRVLAILAAVLSVVGIIACLVVVWFSWSLNTPVTESLVRLAAGAERVLAVADTGLTRVNDGLATARQAVTTLEETVVSAGETIVETNLAFAVLDRTVGDTLFPRVIAAHETLSAIAETVVAFNDTLEAVNRLPMVEVPTLTVRLENAAERLAAARQRVEELQAGLREIKEEKVSRPVGFITNRTGPLANQLDAVRASVSEAQLQVESALARLAALRERLPRMIDLISIAVTLVMLWLIAAQGYVLFRAYRHLSKHVV
jgi:hypothetical protein